MTDQLRESGGIRRTGRSLIGSSDLPLVSVITAVFNGQQYIVNCIESVLQQDYPYIEYIVIDGGSSDGTIDLLRQYDDRIAFWSSEPDRGVYDAWNKGLAIAQGEWICFVGADDEFLPGAISAYMQLAAQEPEAEYLSSRERWVQNSGYERLKGGPWSWKTFSRWNCASCRQHASPKSFRPARYVQSYFQSSCRLRVPSSSRRPPANRLHANCHHKG